ncbi:MAG: hypothetical protein M1814_001549 [Vezdaea aestivalis]|nr:MAG: hypothetical protein M1814_001549 [Vezdaea aestivalis]
MRIPSFFVAIATLSVLAEAHGGIPGAPKLFGRSARGGARVRRSYGPEPRAVEVKEPYSAPHLETRQTTDNRCGSGRGNCAAGVCGQGPDYCSAPDCQITYGPGCDGNKVPAGGSTSGIARPLVGSQPYGGAGIYDCVVNGVVSLTFDDGPWIYTSDILDVLKSYNAKATFFITGINIGKGAIDDASKPWPAIIRRMIADGHQVASHTWSHQDLSTVTAQQRLNQMYYNEMAFRNLLGYFPTYMRPPYSSCNSACQSALRTLGYHITYFDLDTDDYNQATPDKIQTAKNNFANALRGNSPANSDFLAIAHDIHEQTARNLTKFMLDTLVAGGYRAVTVGECLADPIANWYRSAGGSVPTSSSAPPSSTSIRPPSSTSAPPPSSTTSSTPPPSTSKPITKDAKCASNGNGATCQGSQWGNCCSHAGWCGSTDVYCQLSRGCQPAFGTCR